MPVTYCGTINKTNPDNGINTDYKKEPRNLYGFWKIIVKSLSSVLLSNTENYHLVTCRHIKYEVYTDNRTDIDTVKEPKDI